MANKKLQTEGKTIAPTKTVKKATKLGKTIPPKKK